MSVGQLPSSDALAEASAESLSELFSRDPLGYQEQDRVRVVTELRAQRERWEAAESAGKRAPKATKAPLVLKVEGVEDL